MFTPTIALDPNDSRLTQQILDVYIPSPPESKFAKALAAAGEPAMAERADYCGRFAKERCAAGHIDITHQRCAGAFCIDCGPRMLKETCERWEPAVGEAMRLLLDYKGIYQEITIPGGRSRKAADEFFGRLGDAMQNNWRHLVGYRNGRLVIRVLYVVPTHLSAPTQQWPEGTIISTENVHLFQLWWYFENRLMASHLPKDSTDRGEQQALFKGMHRFRSTGLSLKQHPSIPSLSIDTPSEQDFFTDGFEFPVKMSDGSPSNGESPVKSSTKRESLCSTCGLPHIERSQWFPKDAPNPRPSDCRWHPSS
jgi:hypothetical protein